MELDVVTREELLETWRDASRAAELAERLANTALRQVERADENVAATEELATLAEDVAASAERAAQAARDAARRAMRLAAHARNEQAAADQSVTETRLTEEDAAGRFRDADVDARMRDTSDGH